MAKTVKVIGDPETFFSIGEDKIKIGELTVEQAELVAAQYPGRYVEVVDKGATKSTENPK